MATLNQMTEEFYALAASHHSGRALLDACGELAIRLLSSQQQVWEQFARLLQDVIVEANEVADSIGQACRPASIVADRPTGAVHIAEAVMAVRLVTSHLARPKGGSV